MYGRGSIHSTIVTRPRLAPSPLPHPPALNRKLKEFFLLPAILFYVILQTILHCSSGLVWFNFHRVTCAPWGPIIFNKHDNKHTDSCSPNFYRVAQVAHTPVPRAPYSRGGGAEKWVLSDMKKLKIQTITDLETKSKKREYPKMMTVARIL